MSAEIPAGQRLPAGRAYASCERGGSWGWSWWPLIPLVLVGGLVVLWAVTWSLGLPLGWQGPVPFFWPIFPVAFFLMLILFFAIFRFAWWGGPPWGPGHWEAERSAVEILQQRFARGEISREQFHQMLTDVGAAGSALRAQGPR